jgi:hypothetical protein
MAQIKTEKGAIMYKTKAPSKRELTNIYVTNLTAVNHKFLKKDAMSNGMYVGQYLNFILDQLRGQSVSKKRRCKVGSKAPISK